MLKISYGVLSTYPPTQCGLATFSQALVEALRAQKDCADIVSIVDVPEPRPGPGVSHQWVRSDPGGSARAAAALNRYDVAIIQHEYGIFSGRDGADVLAVARAVVVPTIAVLHTVLVTPTAHQRVILETLARNCDTVVTMTHTARQRLIDHYAIDPAVIRVIPHGAADNTSRANTSRPNTSRPNTDPDGDGPDRFASPSTAPRPPSPAPTILTWGLLGEGKGIEWAIEAMAGLRDVRPAPRYRVVGQTHPRVLEQFGERYRNRLIARADELGVAGSVDFDDRYLGQTELHRIIHGADVVLLPYDSREQVTSGVLIEAVTAGIPVVSTGFPHARELLSCGAGLIVERQDPAGMAAALRRVLTEPGLAAQMSAHARRLAPDLLWSAVAKKYRACAIEALTPETVFASA